MFFVSLYIPNATMKRLLLIPLLLLCFALHGQTKDTLIVPKAAIKKFHLLYPDAKEVSWLKGGYYFWNIKPSYEAMFSTADSNVYTVAFDSNWHYTKTLIFFSMNITLYLPQGIKDYASSHFKKFTITNATVETDS